MKSMKGKISVLSLFVLFVAQKKLYEL